MISAYLHHNLIALRLVIAMHESPFHWGPSGHFQINSVPISAKPLSGPLHTTADVVKLMEKGVLPSHMLAHCVLSLSYLEANIYL